MKVTNEDLLELKDRIDLKKEELLMVRGRLEEINKRLLDMGYKSIEEAEADLKKREQLIYETEDKIDKMYNKIKEDYPQLWTD